MNRLIFFAAFFISLISLSQAYLPGTEDVPLMKNLELVEDPIIFDKVEGRLVTLQAQGEVSQKDVLQFYTETLPNLGWKKKTETFYVREGESLKISFEVSGHKKTLVTFEIAPNSHI